MAETEILVGLRFSPQALDLLRRNRRALEIIRRALKDSPEALAAFESFIAVLKNSPNQFFEFFEESGDQLALNLYEQYLAWSKSKEQPSLADSESDSLAQGVAKGIELALLGPKPSSDQLPLKD